MNYRKHEATQQLSKLILMLLTVALMPGCAGLKSFVHDQVCDDGCCGCGEDIIAGTSSVQFDEPQPIPDGTTIQQASNTVVNQNTSAETPPSQIQTVSNQVIQPPLVSPAANSQTSYSTNSNVPNMILPDASDPWAPRTVMLPPGTPQNPALVCEAHLQAANQKFNDKLQAIEAQLESQRALKESMDETLKFLNVEVARLGQEVRHWREEVRRLDRATEEQHRADMASLQTLVEMVGDLSETADP